MKRIRRSKNDRTGASAVEFALTLPVLILFLFSSYELCRANMMFHTAEAAAYEGARLGIVPGRTAQEAEAAARSILATAGIRNASVIVTPADLTTDTDNVSVQIAFRFSDNTIIAPLLMGNGEMSKTCLLTREKL